jgi:hypothetical protein
MIQGSDDGSKENDGWESLESKEIPKGCLAGFIGRSRGQGEPSEKKFCSCCGAIEKNDYDIVEEKEDLRPDGDNKNKHSEQDLDPQTPENHTPIDDLFVVRKQPGDAHQNEHAEKTDEVVFIHGKPPWMRM